MSDTPNFVDIALSVTIPLDDPSEPLLVFFSDGGFEWAYAGDVEWMSDTRLGTDVEVVNAVTAPAVLHGLNDFINAVRGDA